MKSWKQNFMAVLLISLAIIVGCVTSPEEEGDQAYQQGKYDLALKKYDEALKKKPDDFSIQLKRATLFEQQGKVDRAIALYSELIQKYPKKTLPRLYRARLLYKTNDYPTALKDVDRLLNNYSLTAEQKILALALQGEILFAEEKQKESYAVFQEALSLAEENPSFKATYHYRNLLYNISRVAFGLGKFEDSRRYYQKYLERKKLNGIPLTEEDNYFYALVLKYTGNFNEAEEYESKLSPEYRERLNQELSK